MNTIKPWWWPAIIDDNHILCLRNAHLADEDAVEDLSDEELLEEYEDGKELGQFSVAWDNVGDAYEAYEKLAKAFLELVKETGKKPEDFI